MLKNVKKISAVMFLLIFLFFIYCIIAVSFFVSDEYTVIGGSDIDFSLPYFIKSDCKDILNAGTNGMMSEGRLTYDSYKKDVTLKVFGVIPVKTVSVSVVKPSEVIPSGECIGVKIFCDGIVIIGVSDFETNDARKVSPARDAGLKSGDIIKEINGKKILKTSFFTKELDSLNKSCELLVLRNGEERIFTVTPQKSTDGHKRLGIWVRDSIAGIGTMTFYKKDGGSFAALGHGISDSDAEVLMPLKSGNVYKASVLGITKGEKGVPGEIIGSLNESAELGSCYKNLETGIYGESKLNLSQNSCVETASGADVKKGSAGVICTLDESGPKMYSLEILNINRFDSKGTKSMIIKVTDPRLLNKTGGIIQGMSGSPILQNGKLIGAVTHVFVNDPTKGYAIFIENMLNEAE